MLEAASDYRLEVNRKLCVGTLYCIPHSGLTFGNDQCSNSYKTCRPG